VLTKAEVLKNGVALPPLEAPPEVRAIFEAGNTIARSPYKWGGGHGKWQDNGYDCSGSVSYALAAAGLLNAPLASGPLMSWGKPGKGKWITIYTNPGHVFMVVAGVRFDTVARGQTGSRWINAMTGTSGYVARHPEGL
jgi:cell wall-associated NlpC family hydrolase